MRRQERPQGGGSPTRCVWRPTGRLAGAAIGSVSPWIPSAGSAASCARAAWRSAISSSGASSLVQAPTARPACSIGGRRSSRRPPRRLRGLLLELLELGVRLVRGRFGDEGRLDRALDRVLGDDALADVAPRRKLELDVQEGFLEDRPQSPSADLTLERLVGDRAERVLGKDQLDVVELEEALELARQRVSRLGEDRDEGVTGELVDRRDHWQATDELGNQAVLHQVLGQHLLEQLAGVALVAGEDLGAEPDALVADASLDHLVELRERSAADE